MKSNMWFDRTVPLGFAGRHDFDTAIDLLLYIDRKLRSFEEKPRTGIPRDAVRPLTLKKYKAQLWMLLWRTWRASTLADVGKAVGCSASQIRKWLAETAFKRDVLRLRDEFLDGYLKIFLESLEHLYASIGSGGRKDNISRDFEAFDVKRLSMLIKLADDRWGWLMQEEAHRRLDKLLKESVPKDKLQKPSGKEISSEERKLMLQTLAELPIETLNTMGHAIDSRDAFVRLLDLVCFVRSKGKLKVDSSYLPQFHRAWGDANARIHYDLRIAAERNNPDTVGAYSEAQATLSILMADTLCRAMTLLLKSNKKTKQIAESWAIVDVYTPSGLEIYNS